VGHGVDYRERRAVKRFLGSLVLMSNNVESLEARQTGRRQRIFARTFQHRFPLPPSLS
jgi:hypothetical protein